MKQRNKGVSNLMEMKKQEQKDRIPEFTSVEEEAAFWESHDLADYWEGFKPARVRFAKHLSEAAREQGPEGRVRRAGFPKSPILAKSAPEY